MTKDWEAVKENIRELSVDQKKSLEDVKATMERKHKFRASTRAYRMKLKEWGFMRYKRRKQKDDDASMDEEEPQSPDNGETILAAADNDVTAMEDVEVTNDTVTIVDPWSQARTMSTNIVMDMLACILDNDGEKLEELILANPNHVNLPIGLPFDAHGGRFFNHPAMSTCVMMQHPDQTLLDIACGLPPSSIQWTLLAHQAKGSRHPLGTDLAFHNAIKNGRAFTVASLIHSRHSDVAGFSTTHYKPLMQAAYWNVPDIVRLLLDKGARVDDSAAPFDGREFKSALQLALEKRSTVYHDPELRERSIKTVKMLLDAGASIHVPAAQNMISPSNHTCIDNSSLTPFEAFLKPWNSNPLWVTCLESLELDCLEAFIRKGADLQSTFIGFPCSSPTSNTFEHQILWHSTPQVARLLIDHATPIAGANGSNILHEILGSCPDAKRHPADTLRDIDVILKKGGDPNLVDSNGIPPLRKCIERCPGVDIVERITLLLEGGADPELKDRNGVQPIVLAARAFEEPLLSQVMGALISKFRGRYPQNYQGLSRWSDGYFPLRSDPTISQVLRYAYQNDDFTSNLHKMLPSDVHSAFQKAAISVSSTRFLDSVTRRAQTAQEFPLTASEKDEINHIIAMRHGMGLPPYAFDQAFVMTLLCPYTPMSRASDTPIVIDTPTSVPTPSPAPNFSASFFAGRTAPSFTTTATTTTPLALTISAPITLSDLEPAIPITATISTSTSTGDSITPTLATTDSTPHQTSPSSPKSPSSPSSCSFFPETTQIRWTAIGEATKASDRKKAKSLVLKYECESCNNGVKLTKREFEKHEAEHMHTLNCVVVGCVRRFCYAERG